MSASALSEQKPSVSTPELRRVQLRQDLGAIADLIELAFGQTMDASGKAAVREMRALSQSGFVLWLLTGFDRAITRSLGSGYVWVDSGTNKLVGNVSIYPTGYDNAWVVANVAVHPNFRRRGIALTMMEAALETIAQKRGSEAILQVEAHNEGAKRLYEQLGFSTLRTFTRWRRRPYQEPPTPLSNRPQITLAGGRDWRSIWNLAESVRSNAQGGMGWLRPTYLHVFRPSLWKSVFGAKVERFIVRDEANPDKIAGFMRLEYRLGSSYVQTDLLVDPTSDPQIGNHLLNFGIRHLSDKGRGLLLTHPMEDETINAFLHQYLFDDDRHLTHMHWVP